MWIEIPSQGTMVNFTRVNRMYTENNSVILVFDNSDYKLRVRTIDFDDPQDAQDEYQRLTNLLKRG